MRFEKKFCTLERRANLRLTVRASRDPRVGTIVRLLHKWYFEYST